jgi:hypothetical protein
MADRRQRFERQVEAIVRVLRENTTDRGAERRSGTRSGRGRRSERQGATSTPGPRQPAPTA